MLGLPDLNGKFCRSRTATVSAPERQILLVTLYKNTHLLILILKRPSIQKFLKKNSKFTLRKQALDKTHFAWRKTDIVRHDNCLHFPAIPHNSNCSDLPHCQPRTNLISNLSEVVNFSAHVRYCECKRAPTNGATIGL